MKRGAATDKEVNHLRDPNPAILIVNKQEPAFQERLTKRFVSTYEPGECDKDWTCPYWHSLECINERKVIATEARSVCSFIPKRKNQGDDNKYKVLTLYMLRPFVDFLLTTS